MGKALALITQSGEKFSCVAGRESFLVEPDQPFLLLWHKQNTHIQLTVCEALYGHYSIIPAMWFLPGNTSQDGGKKKNTLLKRVSVVCVKKELGNRELHIIAHHLVFGVRVRGFPLKQRFTSTTWPTFRPTGIKSNCHNMPLSKPQQVWAWEREGDGKAKNHQYKGCVSVSESWLKWVLKSNYGISLLK